MELTYYENIESNLSSKEMKHATLHIDRIVYVTLHSNTRKCNQSNEEKDITN